MIEVKNLRYKYPGSREYTLKGIDFSISQGEVFGFLGPSGAGKSTTQKILIGILKQYEGEASVMGQPIHGVKSDYYEKIGVAFEFPNFYSRLTALENLSLFRSLYRGDTEEPSRLLSLLELEKYGTMKVSDYSKGMKMRLNLCRALLNKPDVLFLDEPTSGLDPVNAQKVKDMILAMKAEGKTILITTHNMQAAEDICDRVAFIVDGGISLIDSPRELKIRHGKRRVRVEYKEGHQLIGADFELERIGDNEAFRQILSQPIETIHTQEASLEDIFIEITGRALE